MLGRYMLCRFYVPYLCSVTLPYGGFVAEVKEVKVCSNT
jgi:hypothetical protein